MSIFSTRSISLAVTREAASITSGTESVQMGAPRRVSSLSGVWRALDSSGGVVASGLASGSVLLLVTPVLVAFLKALKMS